MSKLYVLVGIPGSGKSTWARAQHWAPKCAYVSTDQYVEQHALSVGKTYSEVFESYMPRAVELMSQAVIAARDQNQDIIWDQTSTTVASRRRKFNMLPHYYAIAVVFPIPPADELMKRLASRPGKNIPWSVVSGMIQGGQEPTESEGFREIWYV